MAEAKESIVVFKKQRAFLYNDCFTRGTPLEPEDKKAGWT
jgi:hypothetical protein